MAEIFIYQSRSFGFVEALSLVTGHFQKDDGCIVLRCLKDSADAIKQCQYPITAIVLEGVHNWNITETVELLAFKAKAYNPVYVVSVDSVENFLKLVSECIRLGIKPVLKSSDDSIKVLKAKLDGNSDLLNVSDNLRYYKWS